MLSMADVYSGMIGQSSAVDTLLEKLHHRLRAELAFQEKLLETLVRARVCVRVYACVCESVSRKSLTTQACPLIDMPTLPV